MPPIQPAGRRIAEENFAGDNLYFAGAAIAFHQYTELDKIPE
jgi:hypothetical protein